MTAAPIDTDASPGEVSTAVRHALRRLGFYLRRNGGFYSLCVVFILIYNAAFVAIPVLVGRVVAAAESGLGQDVVVERSSWLLAVVIVGAVIRYFSRTMVFNAAREVEYEIRNDLFAHLQRLPQSFYFRWRTGDIMSRCVNDLNSVRLLLGPALLSIIQTPLLFIGVFAVMFTMDPILTLWVIAPYPLFVVIARSFGRGLHARNLAVQVGLSDLSNQLQESISASAVIKAYAMEDRQREVFDARNQELLERHLSLVKIGGAMPAITGLLPALGMVLVLWLGGRSIAEGHMTLAVFFTFAMYIYQLTFPTFIMGWVVALVQRGAASMQRIDEILSIEPSIADRPDTVAVKNLRGEIEFRGLDFAYEGAERAHALRNIELTVPAGTSLGVVGPVGSGKSTLASIIPRLYEIEDGRVFIDGIDLNQIPLATLRTSVAVVPQESFLFSMSLADNIAYGLPFTETHSVEEAARRAQLGTDLAELPDGFDTVVGERGVMLSGGQRQRTALARALALGSRPSVLILDDTLSAVDARTEDAIQRELFDVFTDRTVIVVASRVNTVQHCDQIVVLDAGRIVERGTHAVLLARGGLYRRLSEEQQREEYAASEPTGEPT